MNPIPRIETRVAIIEQKQALFDAQMFEFREAVITQFEQTNGKIDAVAADMLASFQQQAKYQIGLEKQIDARFNAVEVRLDKVESDITEIKATMATKKDLAALKEDIKGDLAAMEGRMLDAFKQLLTVVESRPPQE